MLVLALMDMLQFHLSMAACVIMEGTIGLLMGVLLSQIKHCVWRGRPFSPLAGGVHTLNVGLFTHWDDMKTGGSW